jgi:hypothetical protein
VPERRGQICEQFVVDNGYKGDGKSEKTPKLPS